MNRESFVRFKGVRDCIKRIKDSARGILKISGTDIDKEAHEGQPVAQYITYTDELNYWNEKKIEVDRLLEVTKQTQARNRLLRKKSLIETEILFYKALQETAIFTRPDERKDSE